MGDFEGCPDCAKPVMGRTALLAHLEFSHDVDDPIGYLLELEQPARPSRFRRLRRPEGPKRSARPKSPARPDRSQRPELPERERPEPERPEPERPEPVRFEPARFEPVRSEPERAVSPEPSETPESPERFKRPERPERPRRDLRPLLTWGSGALVAAAVVITGALVATGSPADGTTDGVPAAAGESAAITSPETSAPTADPPPTTDPPATTVVSSASETVSVADFRKPFLLDAHVVTCAPSGPDDVYTVGFTLSGAREIILDGEEFPGRTGDGDHELRHAVPAGSTGYLDRITVFDGGGTAHAVDVTPPLYLGGCSA